MNILRAGETMLKKFSVSNYKNFKDVLSLNLSNVKDYAFNSDCIHDGVISKALIYGRNATGKTNLGYAIMDISGVFSGSYGYGGDETFLNADSGNSDACFLYEFQFGAQEVVYQYTKLSDTRLKYEKLIINDNVIFSCDYSDNEFHFDNMNYIDADSANIQRFRESVQQYEDNDDDILIIPFIRWLINNIALDRDSVLIRLSKYVERMSAISCGVHLIDRPGKMAHSGFFKNLGEEKKLRDLEDFLNAMGVECELTLQNLPEGTSTLYFKHENLLPFLTTASSGTLSLFHLYTKLMSKIQDFSFIYMDEFDAFYHYEMSANIIHYLKKRFPECQIILTTHNTNLMTNRLLRPDCLFVLSQEGKITSLCDATQRELREGHNLEKMYISGEFEDYE